MSDQIFELENMANDKVKVEMASADNWYDLKDYRDKNSLGLTVVGEGDYSSVDDDIGTSSTLALQPRSV